MPARAGFGPPPGSSPAPAIERAPKRALPEPHERGSAPSAAPSAAPPTEPAVPSAPDAPASARVLSAFELATFTAEQLNHRAAAVSRIT
jgi:hypothetical protein